MGLAGLGGGGWEAAVPPLLRLPSFPGTQGLAHLCASLLCSKINKSQTPNIGPGDSQGEGNHLYPLHTSQICV